MSRQAFNMFITGASGSGKTTYLHEVIRAGKNRCLFDICVNTSRQLSEFYTHRYYLGSEQLSKRYDPAKLADLIRAQRSIHFEVAPGDGVYEFMDSLGQACMSLGQFETRYGLVRITVDEAQNFLPKHNMPPGMKRVEAEGRKFGVDIIKVTPVFGSTGDDTVDSAAYKQATRVAIFPMGEQRQRERVMQTWPEIPDPGTFKYPDPQTKRPGEYAVYDRLTGRGVVARLAPDGSRYLEKIGAWRYA